MHTLIVSHSSQAAVTQQFVVARDLDADFIAKHCSCLQVCAHIIGCVHCAQHLMHQLCTSRTFLLAALGACPNLLHWATPWGITSVSRCDAATRLLRPYTHGCCAVAGSLSTTSACSGWARSHVCCSAVMRLQPGHALTCQTCYTPLPSAPAFCLC